MEFEYHEFDEIQLPKKSLEENENQFNNKLVYMNSSLARQLHFSENEEKLFAMAISQLDFYDENSNFSVKIRAKDVQRKLGLAYDKAFYTNLRKSYKALQKKTTVDFDLGNESHDWIVGNLIRTITSNKRQGNIVVTFEENLRPALQYCKIAYSRIPLDDVTSYISKYAIILQRYLTTLYRSGKEYPLIQTFDFTTKQLKELFGLSQSDYCYKSGKNKGKFDRPNFEKKTVKLACNEINSKSSVMRVEYEKERSNGIMYYRISCKIATKIKKEPPVVDVDYEKQDSMQGEVEQGKFTF